MLWPCAKAVLTIHRDFGDRTDRKHARLKMSSRSAERIGTRRGSGATRRHEDGTSAHYKFTSHGRRLRWNKARWNVVPTLFVETGRVKDAKKIAVRRVAEKFGDVESAYWKPKRHHRNVVSLRTSNHALLAEHGVKTDNPGKRAHAAADGCPALPRAVSHSPSPNGCCPALLNGSKSFA